MKFARLIALALLALVLAAGCSKESETLKIGAVLSVTGPASFLGEPEKNTLMMLQDDINAKGGVDGRKLEIIVYDDESDVNKCVMAAKKLLEQDKVAAVIGPSILRQHPGHHEVLRPGRGAAGLLRGLGKDHLARGPLGLQHAPAGPPRRAQNPPGLQEEGLLQDRHRHGLGRLRPVRPRRAPGARPGPGHDARGRRGLRTQGHGHDRPAHQDQGP